MVLNVDIYVFIHMMTQQRKGENDAYVHAESKSL